MLRCPPRGAFRWCYGYRGPGSLEQVPFLHPASILHWDCGKDDGTLLYKAMLRMEVPSTMRGVVYGILDPPRAVRDVNSQRTC